MGPGPSVDGQQRQLADRPELLTRLSGGLPHVALAQRLLAIGGQSLEPRRISLPGLDLDQIAASPGAQRRCARHRLLRGRAAGAAATPSCAALTVHAVNLPYGSQITTT